MSYRFVAGGASIAYNTCQTVYCVELAGQKWRTFTNNYFRALPFALGNITLAVLVYLVPNMRTLEIIMAVSGIPMLIVLFFLPESPRWLFINGQYDKVSHSMPNFASLLSQP